MKISPVSRFDHKLSADSTRTKDWLKDMRTGFKEDEQGRSEWVEKKRYWMRRRYMEENRRPNFPWPGAPLHRDTEILTIDSWVKITDVKIGMLVLTRDDRDHGSEWCPVLALPRVYSDTLIHFRNQSVDLLVTPGHTMVYDDMATGKTIRRKAEEEEGLTGYGIPLTSRFRGHDLEKMDGLPSGDLFEFIGWYIAEGSIAGGCTIGIAQSKEANEEKCQHLQSLFDRLGFGYSYSGNTYYTGVRSGVPHWLRELLQGMGGAREKRLPAGFFHFAPQLLQRLLDGLLGGDGHVRQREHQNLPQAVFHTTSEHLAGDVQALAQLIGKRAKVGFRMRPGGVIDGRQIASSAYFEVSILHDEMTKWSNLERTEEPYHDFAYCVTVENHAIYVRYSGKACWTGNSEIVLPLIDMNIDRMKPLFVNLVANAHPPVTVLAATSEQMKQAPTIELFFDWLIRTHSPNFIQEIIYGVDDMLECGMMILKSFWRYETRSEYETLTYRSMPEKMRQFIVVESKQQVAQFQALTGQTLMTKIAFKEFDRQIRQVVTMEMDLDEEESQDRKAIDDIMQWLRSGAEKPITFKKRNTVHDTPAIVACNPARVIVSGATTSVEDAPRITHEMEMTATELKSRVKDLGWKESVVDELIKMGAKTTRPRHRSWQEGDGEEALREGVTYRNNDHFTIYETIAYFDHDQDKRDENVVCVWSPDVDEPLSFYAYSRPSGRRPYHRAVFEPNKRRWYSPRGIPEKISDIDWEVTFQHRSKLNRMMIANAPTFMYRMHRNVNPQNFRWIPGQMVPVMDPSDVAPMQVPNLDMSFEREEQLLKTWVEQALGASDFSLSNPLSSLTEPRTKYEIQQIQASAQQALSLRGLVFQHMMEEVYDEFFDLWLTYGPDEIYANVTGEDPVRLTREDLQGDYHFQATGSIGQEDPTLKAQKALSRLQVLNSIAQVPGLLGNEFELNLGEALIDWMETDDIRAARRIIRRRTPEEIKKLEQEQAQQQQMQGAMQGLQAGQLFGQATQPGGGSGSAKKTA